MKILKQNVIKEQSLGGGCIANARKVTLENGQIVFVKSGTSPDSFRLEANGLNELAKAKAIKIPKVLHFDNQMLVTEYIEQGRKGKDFYETFGRQFAQMHKYTSDGFGFFEDNYIGGTPQLNLSAGQEKTDWPTFYFTKRLKFQYELAISNGYNSEELTKLFVKLEGKLPEIISTSKEAPSLMHGDLWSGNYMVGPNGEAVLIDPAVYYGHREADLAMTRVFGGFSSEFYEAYQQTYPLQDGWEYRENIYKLYHILNHLNLFGSGYYGQTIALMRYYV